MRNILTNIGDVLKISPNCQKDLASALSKGQIDSKMWLIDELANITISPGITFVLGGWLGTLGLMMLESKRFNDLKIRSIDINPNCTSTADTLNRTPWVKEGWQFKASTADMYELDYTLTTHRTFRADGSFVELTEEPSTIINTACEHLEDFNKWWDLIPIGKLVVLQSNNMQGLQDHCNCVNSLQEFLEKTNMTKVIYSGERELRLMTRFMIIGYK